MTLFSNDENIKLVDPVTSVEVKVTGSKAMLALSFSSLLLKYLKKRLEKSALGLVVGKILGGCLFESISTIWCSSLQDDIAILPLYN